jgi:hypothetical protein
MHQTDEPIEYPETRVTDADIEADGDGLDTEGHSLASMGIEIARERAREDAKYARDEARRHEAAKPRKSIRERFFGR